MVGLAWGNANGLDKLLYVVSSTKIYTPYVYKHAYKHHKMQCMCALQTCNCKLQTLYFRSFKSLKQGLIDVTKSKAKNNQCQKQHNKHHKTENKSEYSKQVG